jgi:hypothetical protein
MRKVLFAISLVGALTLALAVNAAAPTNFAGTWALDKSKSQGLGRGMQNAESVTWAITQDGKQITIEQKIAGADMPGGGGGGGRGMGGMMGPRSYNLDGSETNSENGPANLARKANWSSDGKTLELITKATFNGPNGEVTTTSSDKLQLSADGKVLTVNQHREGRQGAQDSTLVFNKS